MVDIVNNGKTVATKDIYADLDIFFRKHPITGDIAFLTNVEAVKRSVRNLINTSVSSSATPAVLIHKSMMITNDYRCGDYGYYHKYPFCEREISPPYDCDYDHHYGYDYDYCYYYHLLVSGAITITYYLILIT